MKILVIISSILIAQTSASFFDVFQGAVLSVQNSFGKIISDVVSDVKETVDCTILAVEHALALSEDAAIRYYNKCGSTINNTVTVTETRHIESSPQGGVSMQFPSEDYLKKEIPAVIDAKINETLTKILGSYNPSEKLRDVENVLAKEKKQLANVSNLVKHELKKVSSEVTSDLKNIAKSHADPSVDGIIQEIKLLENQEQKSKNNSQATEIHQVIDEVLGKLDNIAATEATENVKLEHVLKDLELNSNSSFIDLRQQLVTWKEEESRHFDDIQTTILEHERNSQPNVHNNSLNLPPVQYDSDIRETNVKEVNIISTKRISNTPRETASIDTSVNAKNEQSHMLTFTKPKTNNNGHGNLSGVSSTSNTLKISHTTPNVSKDSDLKITVIRSKSYSLSKSVSISGKKHQAESNTDSNTKSSVHLTTDHPSTTMRLGTSEDKSVTILVSTTENTLVNESNIISTNMPGKENSYITSTEQSIETTNSPSSIITVSDSTTENIKTAEIENETTTNILNDISNNTTTGSDLVTEQSSTSPSISSISHKEIKSTLTDRPTTTETVTTVSDTTTRRLTESENTLVNSSILNEKEEPTTTEIYQPTVSDHSIDYAVRITTSEKPIETSTVTPSNPDYSTTRHDYEAINLQTDLPTTTTNDLDSENLQTTPNKEDLSEFSTEQSTKPYEEQSITNASNNIKTTTTQDFSTVNPKEINTEQSTLDVEESRSSLNILNNEYTSNSVMTTIPALITEVPSEGSTELITRSNDDENTANLKSVTTFKPETNTENNFEFNTEQSTTSYGEEIRPIVKTVDTATNQIPVLSTNSPEISTTTKQRTTPDEEITSSEFAINTVTTVKPDIVTETIEDIITGQSTTYQEEPTTNLNIAKTTETDLITESPSERHIEQSTTPYDEEEVPTNVSDVRIVATTESDIITEKPDKTLIEQKSMLYAEEITTRRPLHIVDRFATAKSSLITENDSESRTEQNYNLKENEITTDADEVNALISKYSNNVVTTTAPDVVTEHVQMRTTAADEEFEDLSKVNLPTAANNLHHGFTDTLTVTTPDTILETDTESLNIHTNVYDSEHQFGIPGVHEPIAPTVNDFVTASTRLRTFESPFENMEDGDILRTSTQRSKRTRKRNLARSSRKRNSTATVAEMSTAIRTTTNIESETVATEKIPIAIEILPVFRSSSAAGSPIIADHIHSNKKIPLVNTYVPHYKERPRIPSTRSNPPVILNEEKQNENIHEIESSRHSAEQSRTPLNFPKSDLPNNHEITRQNPKSQERHSRHFDEAPNPTENHRFNRATPHIITENAFESTTPRQQRSTKRNRTRRLDRVTDSPKTFRERTPDLIAPANRKRANRNTRRTNRPSSEMTEIAYRSRATTVQPVKKNSYDMSPADYDAFFNIPPKNSAAHLAAVSRAHELISNSQRSHRVIDSILENKKRNGAKSLFDSFR